MNRFNLFAVALLLAGNCAAARSDNCTRRNAVRATVPQIAAKPDRHEGRCVAVDGVMQRHSLFESVDGAYLQPPDSLDLSSSGFQIGVDGLGSHFSERYRHVSIVGRVQDCETVREMVHSTDSDTVISFVGGYCHSCNGAYIYIHDEPYLDDHKLVPHFSTPIEKYGLEEPPGPK